MSYGTHLLEYSMIRNEKLGVEILEMLTRGCYINNMFDYRKYDFVYLQYMLIL